jgi:hypothetical protein
VGPKRPSGCPLNASALVAMDHPRHHATWGAQLSRIPQMVGRYRDERLADRLRKPMAYGIYNHRKRIRRMDISWFYAFTAKGSRSGPTLTEMYCGPPHTEKPAIRPSSAKCESIRKNSWQASGNAGLTAIQSELLSIQRLAEAPLIYKNLTWNWRSL